MKSFRAEVWSEIWTPPELLRWSIFNNSVLLDSCVTEFRHPGARVQKHDGSTSEEPGLWGKQTKVKDTEERSSSPQGERKKNFSSLKALRAVKTDGAPTAALSTAIVHHGVLLSKHQSERWGWTAFWTFCTSYSLFSTQTSGSVSHDGNLPAYPADGVQTHPDASGQTLFQPWCFGWTFEEKLLENGNYSRIQRWSCCRETWTWTHRIHIQSHDQSCWSQRVC